MATYSAFFSSGLLAPRVARCGTTPVLPSSPMAISISAVDPVDRQLSLTPMPLGQTSPRPEALEACVNSERPRMRRRRSSINVGTSPMALIKSPVRNAGAALQRTGLMSPTRHRAASVGMNEAFETNSLFGRLRSGSVGGVPNPPRRLRREIRRPIPPAPPPNAPLPAPPSSPAAKCSSSFFPPAALEPMLRRPLTTNSSRAENPFSPALLVPVDRALKIPFKLPPGFSGTCGGTIDETMMED